MKKITYLLLSAMIIATIGGSFIGVASPTAAYAQNPTGETTETVESSTCDRGILGFPTWYRGISKDAECNLKSPSELGDNGLSKFIWTIGLNVVEIVLMLAGYVTVAYIIYGGFLLMTGRGKPAEIAEGQMTIRNAVIGFVISLGSIAIVNFIIYGVLGK